MIDELSSLGDVAFAVCTALAASDIEAVLTGGSAAAHYAPITVQSYDADFILRFGATGGERAALAAIGFVQTPSHYFAHPRTVYTVEFPAGPLAIGSDLLTTWNTERRGDDVLHVLTPTDCVRDRFMAFFSWGDISALDSAVRVAQTVGTRFDVDAFSQWAEREATANVAYDRRRIAIFLSRLREG